MHKTINEYNREIDLELLFIKTTLLNTPKKNHIGLVLISKKY